LPSVLLDSLEPDQLRYVLGGLSGQSLPVFPLGVSFRQACVVRFHGGGLARLAGASAYFSGK
jgi:hypothetical protein